MTVAGRHRFLSEPQLIYHAHMRFIAYVMALVRLLFDFSIYVTKHDDQTHIALCYLPQAGVARFLPVAVATAVPILRGEKRKDAAEWGGIPAFTADAE